MFNSFKIKSEKSLMSFKEGGSEKNIFEMNEGGSLQMTGKPPNPNRPRRMPSDSFLEGRQLPQLSGSHIGGSSLLREMTPKRKRNPSFPSLNKSESKLDESVLHEQESSRKPSSKRENSYGSVSGRKQLDVVLGPTNPLQSPPRRQLPEDIIIELNGKIARMEIAFEEKVLKCISENSHQVKTALNFQNESQMKPEKLGEIEEKLARLDQKSDERLFEFKERIENIEKRMLADLKLGENESPLWKFQEIFDEQLKILKDNFERQKEKLDGERERARAELSLKEKGKLDRVSEDSEKLKSSLSQLEKRISDENQRRLNQELINQEWFDGKILRIKEEMRREQKNNFTEDAKFINNLHETVKAMSEIIKNTKAQLETSILTTQTMTSDTIDNLGKELAIFKEFFMARNREHERESSDLDERLDSLKSELREMGIKLREKMKKDSKEAEQKIAEIEKTMGEELNGLVEQIEEKQNEQMAWNEEIEEKLKRHESDLVSLAQETKEKIETELKAEGLREKIRLVKNDLEKKTKMIEEWKNDMEENMRGANGRFEKQLSAESRDLEEKLGKQMEALREEVRRNQEFSIKTMEGLINSLVETTKEQISLSRIQNEERLKEKTGKLKKKLKETKENAKKKLRPLENHEKEKAETSLVFAKEIEELKRDLEKMKKSQKEKAKKTKEAKGESQKSKEDFGEMEKRIENKMREKLQGIIDNDEKEKIEEIGKSLKGLSEEMKRSLKEIERKIDRATQEINGNQKVNEKAIEEFERSLKVKMKKKENEREEKTKEIEKLNEAKRREDKEENEKRLQETVSPIKSSLEKAEDEFKGKIKRNEEKLEEINKENNQRDQKTEEEIKKLKETLANHETNMLYKINEQGTEYREKMEGLKERMDGFEEITEGLEERIEGVKEKAEAVEKEQWGFRDIIDQVSKEAKENSENFDQKSEKLFRKQRKLKESLAILKQWIDDLMDSMKSKEKVQNDPNDASAEEIDNKGNEEERLRLRLKIESERNKEKEKENENTKKEMKEKMKGVMEKLQEIERKTDENENDEKIGQFFNRMVMRAGREIALEERKREKEEEKLERNSIKGEMSSIKGEMGRLKEEVSQKDLEMKGKFEMNEKLVDQKMREASLKVEECFGSLGKHEEKTRSLLEEIHKNKKDLEALLENSKEHQKELEKLKKQNEKSIEETKREIQSQKKQIGEQIALNGKEKMELIDNEMEKIREGLEETKEELKQTQGYLARFKGETEKSQKELESRLNEKLGKTEKELNEALDEAKKGEELGMIRNKLKEEKEKSKKKMKERLLKQNEETMGKIERELELIREEMAKLKGKNEENQEEVMKKIKRKMEKSIKEMGQSQVDQGKLEESIKQWAQPRLDEIKKTTKVTNQAMNLRINALSDQIQREIELLMRDHILSMHHEPQEETLRNKSEIIEEGNLKKSSGMRHQANIHDETTILNEKETKNSNEKGARKTGEDINGQETSREKMETRGMESPSKDQDENGRIRDPETIRERILQSHFEDWTKKKVKKLKRTLKEVDQRSKNALETILEEEKNKRKRFEEAVKEKLKNNEAALEKEEELRRKLEEETRGRFKKEEKKWEEQKKRQQEEKEKRETEYFLNGILNKATEEGITAKFKEAIQNENEKKILQFNESLSQQEKRMGEKLEKEMSKMAKSNREKKKKKDESFKEIKGKSDGQETGESQNGPKEIEGYEEIIERIRENEKTLSELNEVLEETQKEIKEALEEALKEIKKDQIQTRNEHEQLRSEQAQMKKGQEEFTKEQNESRHERIRNEERQRIAEEKSTKFQEEMKEKIAKIKRKLKELGTKNTKDKGIKEEVSELRKSMDVFYKEQEAKDSSREYLAGVLMTFVQNELREQQQASMENARTIGEHKSFWKNQERINMEHKKLMEEIQNEEVADLKQKLRENEKEWKEKVAGTQENIENLKGELRKQGEIGGSFEIVAQNIEGLQKEIKEIQDEMKRKAQEEMEKHERKLSGKEERKQEDRLGRKENEMRDKELEKVKEELEKIKKEIEGIRIQENESGENGKEAQEEINKIQRQLKETNKEVKEIKGRIVESAKEARKEPVKETGKEERNSGEMEKIQDEISELKKLSGNPAMANAPTGSSELEPIKKDLKDFKEELEKLKNGKAPLLVDETQLKEEIRKIQEEINQLKEQRKQIKETNKASSKPVDDNFKEWVQDKSAGFEKKLRSLEEKFNSVQSKAEINQMDEQTRIDLEASLYLERIYSSLFSLPVLPEDFTNSPASPRKNHKTKSQKVKAPQEEKAKENEGEGEKPKEHQSSPSIIVQRKVIQSDYYDNLVRKMQSEVDQIKAQQLKMQTVSAISNPRAPLAVAKDPTKEFLESLFNEVEVERTKRDLEESIKGVSKEVHEAQERMFKLIAGEKKMRKAETKAISLKLKAVDSFFTNEVISLNAFVQNVSSELQLRIESQGYLFSVYHEPQPITGVPLGLDRAAHEEPKVQNIQKLEAIQADKIAPGPLLSPSALDDAENRLLSKIKETNEKVKGNQEEAIKREERISQDVKEREERIRQESRLNEEKMRKDLEEFIVTSKKKEIEISSGMSLVKMAISTATARIEVHGKHISHHDKQIKAQKEEIELASEEMRNGLKEIRKEIENIKASKGDGNGGKES